MLYNEKRNRRFYMDFDTWDLIDELRIMPDNLTVQEFEERVWDFWSGTDSDYMFKDIVEEFQVDDCDRGDVGRAVTSAFQGEYSSLMLHKALSNIYEYFGIFQAFTYAYPKDMVDENADEDGVVEGTVDAIDDVIVTTQRTRVIFNEGFIHALNEMEHKYGVCGNMRSIDDILKYKKPKQCILETLTDAWDDDYHPRPDLSWESVDSGHIYPDERDIKECLENSGCRVGSEDYPKHWIGEGEAEDREFTKRVNGVRYYYYEGHGWVDEETAEKIDGGDDVWSGGLFEEAE